MGKLKMKNKPRCVSNKHKPLSSVDGDYAVLSLSPAGVSHSGNCRKGIGRCVDTKRKNIAFNMFSVQETILHYHKH